MLNSNITIRILTGLSIEEDGCWSCLLRMENSLQFMWSSTYIIWRQMKNRRRSPLINHQNATYTHLKAVLRSRMYNSQRMTSIPLPNFSRRKIILLRRGRFLASKIHWATLEQCQITPSILRKINLSILSRWKVRESAVAKCSNPKKHRAWKDPIIYIHLNNFNATKPWWISTPSWVLKRVSLSTILTKS